MGTRQKENRPSSSSAIVHRESRSRSGSPITLRLSPLEAAGVLDLPLPRLGLGVFVQADLTSRAPAVVHAVPFEQSSAWPRAHRDPHTGQAGCVDSPTLSTLSRRGL